MTVSLSLHDASASHVGFESHSAQRDRVKLQWATRCPQAAPSLAEGEAVQLKLGASICPFMAESQERSMPSWARSWGGCSAALAASGALNRGLTRATGAEESQAA